MPPKKRKKAEKINAVMAWHIIAVGYNEYRMLTIYEDYTIAIGSIQKLYDPAGPLRCLCLKT